MYQDPQKRNTMKKIIIIVALSILGIAAQAQEETRMYDVKSGIVTMEMDMMGRKVVQDIYFDDYGAKQAMIVEMRGQKMRGIEVDGYNSSMIHGDLQSKNGSN